jgi:2-iminobutanoate/2-iminopropanoate deaminase
MSDFKTIAVDNAPKAIGPYAQGIAAGGFLFTAGQTPLDPATMKLVEGDVAAQTARVLDNLEAVLKGAGLTFADVVRAGVFLVDMGDFAKMNEVFAAGAAGVTAGTGDGAGSSAKAGREMRAVRTRIARVPFMEISSRRRPRRREPLV